MNLGPAEILVILVVALVVFGPKRLPEVGRQVGGALRELRKVQDTVRTEIRRRIIICIVAIGVGAIVAFIFSNRIIGFLIGPYRDVARHHHSQDRLVATDPLAPFLVRLKIATYGGIVFALPVWL